MSLKRNGGSNVNALNVLQTQTVSEAKVEHDNKIRSDLDERRRRRCRRIALLRIARRTDMSVEAVYLTQAMTETAKLVALNTQFFRRTNSYNLCYDWLLQNINFDWFGSANQTLVFQLTHLVYARASPALHTCRDARAEIDGKRDKSKWRNTRARETVAHTRDRLNERSTSACSLSLDQS